MTVYIKSPLNYIGGKYKILDQIIPLFPKEIDYFVDLFAGGLNVGINSFANKIIVNDNMTFLIDLYERLVNTPESIVLNHIDDTIRKFKLSLVNSQGYMMLRDQYNNKGNVLDLLTLTFYSFNHQIRFNNSHKFNIPFGKNRSQYNKTIKTNLVKFIQALQLKKCIFSRLNFDLFDYSKLTKNDFVYCDPPYLISTGTYNDGKRGFTGWDKIHEQKLFDILDNLDRRGIKFAYSNVLTHKGITNDLLKLWLKKNKYVVHMIRNDFTNSSYHAKQRDKSLTQEILVRNYS